MRAVLFLAGIWLHEFPAIYLSHSLSVKLRVKLPVDLPVDLRSIS